MTETETLQITPDDILKRIQQDEQLPAHWLDDALLWITRLASFVTDLHYQRQKPLLIGINGAQGSGKTTLALALDSLLTGVSGLRCQTLSIDDFYLSRQQRQQLAEQVHPLLQTRGVPGTHNCDAARDTIQQLKQGHTCPLPCFDKATDNPLPESEWTQSISHPDVILLEGWCVGIPPQPAQKLGTPVNDLEQHEDVAGHWRNYVHEQLSGPYQALFTELDYLVFLKAPGFECVYQWRLEQERKLALRTRHRQRSAIMDEAQIKRFIAHYQRLTEHALLHLPSLANVVIPLDRNHRLTGCEVNHKQDPVAASPHKSGGLTP